MKRFFPIMNDEPEKGMQFALFAYWFFAFLLVPLFIPMLADGLWENHQVTSWMEIIYHCLNGVVIVIMLKSYLADSFLNVQLNLKGFLLVVGTSVLVLLALVTGLRRVLVLGTIDYYPVCEMIVALTSGYLVTKQPVFGTLCYSLVVPFAVTGLFYVTCFAPVCRRSRWLGYVVMTVLLVIPCILDIMWRKQALVIVVYIMQLPVHWVACWTYQKTDTVWAPIVTVALFNLGTSLLALL